MQQFPGYRLEGDRDAAANHVPTALNLLYHARAMARSSANPIVRVIRNIAGGYIEATIIGGFERVLIVATTGGVPRRAVLKPIDMLSGVVRTGELVEDGDTLTLRAFKATQDAWQGPLGSDPAKTPDAFHDEPRLAVEVSESLDVAGSQYAAVIPSMYSGRMATLVQAILGYGKLDADTGVDGDYITEGVKVLYDFRWERCHGLVTAADGAPWLVEVSSANGVLAMPLPLFAMADAEDGLRSDESVDAVRKTVDLFGGLPSGGTFPADAALATAIAAGDILQLLTASDMDPFFGKSAFHPAMGWAFKQDGTEAHNTCYAYEPDDTTNLFGYLYKLEIQIEAPAEDREPGDPIAEASAALTMVESGRVVNDLAHSPGTGSGPFAFNGLDGTRTPVPSGRFPDEEVPDEEEDIVVEEVRAPVLACYIEDELDVVYFCYRYKGIVETAITSDIPEGEYFGTSSGYTHRTLTGPFIASTRYPDTRSGRNDNDYNQVYTQGPVVGTGFTPLSYNPIDGLWTIRQYQTGYIQVNGSLSTVLKNSQSGQWSGARDSYVLCQDAGRETAVTVDEEDGVYSITLSTFTSEERIDVGVDLPGEENHSFTTITQHEPEVLLITAPGEEFNVSETPTGDASAARAVWKDPYGGSTFACRFSVFGELLHATYPYTATAATNRLVGDLFSGEDQPAEAQYNFIGYL